MQITWIKRKIQELRDFEGDLTGWGQILDDALRSGKLRGLTLKTPLENGIVGETFILHDHGFYSP